MNTEALDLRVKRSELFWEHTEALDCWFVQLCLSLVRTEDILYVELRRKNSRLFRIALNLNTGEKKPPALTLVKG